ncbi:MAG TPA: flagellin, partial [Holophaga sp.]|nr:flagellin [Holophaga sp.]
MPSILNNVAALGASRQLSITNRELERTIERLTTGRRINRASDDAAGLGISNKLGADIRIAAQGKRNANDGISYLQVADGVLEEVTSLLTRAAELTEQAKTGTISNTNRVNIDAEFQNIIRSLVDIGQNTQFNGQNIFGSAATVSVGTFTAIGITVATIASSGTNA